MATQSVDFTPSESTAMRTRSFLGEGVLLVFCLLTLGVLEPELSSVNFRDKTLQLVIDDGAANLANQLLWLALASVATLAISRQFGRLWSLVLAAWPLMLVLVYCLLSAVWSDYPDISVRRCFGLIIPAYCLMAAIAVVDRPARIAKILYLAFWAALVCNLLALSLPSAYDEVGFFRGVTSNKNILGGLGALAILSGVAISPLINGIWSRTLLLLYVAGWSYLLIVSVSKTSIALTLCVPILICALSWVSMGLRTSVASLAGILATVLLTITGVSYAVLGTTLADVVYLAWDDATFTGRTQIWNFMLDEIGENWITGIGFGSFWGVGASSPNLYAGLDYIRLINQAHNGYLDLLATVGVLGIILVIVMLAQVLRKTEKFRVTQRWQFRFVWFIVAFSIIHNAMESSLLVPFSIVWHLTLLAYVVGVWSAQQAAS